MDTLNSWRLLHLIARLAILFTVSLTIAHSASAVAGTLPEPDCERKIISKLLSPDDTWTAVVEEDLCSHGPAFTTVILDRVRLVRRGEKAKDDSEVLVTEEGGRWENRPQTEWLSPRNLQITLPNKIFLNLKKPNYNDIEISIKFNPNDPLERKRFLEERGLPPD